MTSGTGVITLPNNSLYYDFSLETLQAGETYLYRWLYDGTDFIWSRYVVKTTT